MSACMTRRASGATASRWAASATGARRTPARGQYDWPAGPGRTARWVNRSGPLWWGRERPDRVRKYQDVRHQWYWGVALPHVDPGPILGTQGEEPTTVHC